MGLRNLATLLFMTTGFVILALALPALGNAIGVLSVGEEAWASSGEDAWTLVLAASLPAIAQALLGLALIFGARGLVRALFGGMSEQTVTATAADLHAIVLSGAGLLVLGLALRSMPNAIWQLTRYFGDRTVGYGRPLDWALPSVGVGLQAALGLGMFVASSSIVGLIRQRWNRRAPIQGEALCEHCGALIDLGLYRPGASIYRCSRCHADLPRELVARLAEAGDRPEAGS